MRQGWPHARPEADVPRPPAALGHARTRARTGWRRHVVARQYPRRLESAHRHPRTRLPLRTAYGSVAGALCAQLRHSDGGEPAWLRQSLAVVSCRRTHGAAPGELRELLDVLDHAEYPLLLHCRHGSDRTGLAAAVVLLLQDGVPYARARRELGLYYGHLSFGRTGLLDSFFEMYEEWLRATGKDHTPAVFRHWVLDEYRGGWCEGGVENVAATGAPKAGQPIAYRVRLRNRSQATWQLTPITTAGIHVYYHVWDADGAVVADARAGFVEASIPPGARYEVTIVVPPLKAGHYWLAVDLIEEYHCCFYQVGAEVWEEELIVP
jgi:hypothetical protein